MKENLYLEGEIFAIPLSIEEDSIKHFKSPYAFGRLIAINPSKDKIVEIFRYYGNMTDDIEMIKSSGRLFPPISVVNYARKRRWRRIYSDPQYCYEDAKFSEVRFCLGSLVWEGGKTRLMKKEEEGMYETNIIYEPIQVETRIRKALGLDKESSNLTLSHIKEANVIQQDIDEKIAPFYWVEWEDEERVSVNLDCGVGYKQELFKLYSKDGFIGNGYDWNSLASAYINKMNRNVKNYIHFDSESSLFCVYSDNKEVLKEFIFGFSEVCENDSLFKELFLNAKLD